MQQWSSQDSCRPMDPSPSDRAAFGSMAMSEDTAFFARQNAKLQGEMERLKAKLEEAQDEIDRMAGDKAKADASKEREDLAAKHRPKMDSKGKRNSNLDEEDSAVDEGTALKGGARASGKHGAPKEAMKVDSRKMLEDFKKPLEDTRSIIIEFSNAKNVPTAVALGEVEALQDALKDLESSSKDVVTRINALTVRNPNPKTLSRTARMRFDETQASLKDEQRRIENAIGAMSDKMTAKRDDVIARSMHHRRCLRRSLIFAFPYSISMRLYVLAHTANVQRPRSHLAVLQHRQSFSKRMRPTPKRLKTSPSPRAKVPR